MAIKVKVKQPNVFFAVDGVEQEVEIGKILEIDADELPSYLVGKAEIIGESQGKEFKVASESKEVKGK